MQDTRTILLTQGQVAIVDAADYERISAHKWCAWWNPCTRSFYAVRSTSAVVDGKRKRTNIYMHREVLGLEPGNPLQGDHGNHETLRNTQDNLRAATRSQQQHNTRRRADNRSGYKGVAWSRLISKWTATIVIDSKKCYLGAYNSAEEAARAYDTRARLEFGAFALCNFRAEQPDVELPVAA